MLRCWTIHEEIGSQGSIDMDLSDGDGGEKLHFCTVSQDLWRH